MIIFLVVYFLNNKIKTMSIFSRNHVKLIILKGLMSLLVHYVLQLFLFSTLSFKMINFTWLRLKIDIVFILLFKK